MFLLSSSLKELDNGPFLPQVCFYVPKLFWTMFLLTSYIGIQYRDNYSFRVPQGFRCFQKSFGIGNDTLALFVTSLTL